MGDSVTRLVESLKALAHRRGSLLDLFAFVVNILGMTFFSGFMRSTIRHASNGDSAASNLLFCFGVALFVLAPIGATLSRWHFHQRRGMQAPEPDAMGGCFFNPIFYFCTTTVVFAAINAFALQTVYGKSEPNGDVFVTSILLGLVLIIVHTGLVYRYFSKPSKPPRSAFLRSKSSQVIGDVCLFANMAIFQSLWCLLAQVKAPPPTSVFDFFARIVLLFFMALLLYFPPRVFYLAEDMGKRGTWIGILLGNSPILLRFVFGLG